MNDATDATMLLVVVPVMIGLGFLWWLLMVLFLGLYRFVPFAVIGPHNSGVVLRSSPCWHLVRWHGSDTEAWVHKLDVKRAPAGLFPEGAGLK